MEEEYKEAVNTYQLVKLETIIVCFTLILTIGGLAFYILRRTSNTITKVISELDGHTKSLDGSTSEISMNSENLAASSLEQSSSLTETASAMEEIRQMCRSSFDTTKQSVALATEGQEHAMSGLDQMKNLSNSISAIDSSIGDIKEQSDSSFTQFREIIAVIEEIANKTKLIDDIVFQTKLLSFNASVEAARAGESGRGFAVVAEEVGNLAHSSGQASSEINELLTKSRKKVHSIIETNSEKIMTLTTKGQQTAAKGKAVATVCDKKLEEIVKSSQNLSTMIENISSACEQQLIGVDEVTNASAAIDSSIHKNSKLANDSAIQCRDISESANELKNIVDTLNKAINGEGAAIEVANEVALEEQYDKDAELASPLNLHESSWNRAA